MTYRFYSLFSFSRDKNTQILLIENPDVTFFCRTNELIEDRFDKVCIC